MTNQVFFWMLGALLLLMYLILWPSIWAYEKGKISKGLMSALGFSSMILVPTLVFWLFLPTKGQETKQFNVSSHIYNHSPRCTSYKINGKETDCNNEAFVYLNATNSDSLNLKHQIKYNRFGQVLVDRYVLTDKRTKELLEVSHLDKK